MSRIDINIWKPETGFTVTSLLNSSSQDVDVPDNCPPPPPTLERQTNQVNPDHNDDGYLGDDEDTEYNEDTDDEDDEDTYDEDDEDTGDDEDDEDNNISPTLARSDSQFVSGTSPTLARSDSQFISGTSKYW